jgi:predicted nuclease with TOPRIM domain
MSESVVCSLCYKNFRFKNSYYNHRKRTHNGLGSYTQLGAENDDLEAENNELEAENNELTVENTYLRDRINVLQAIEEETAVAINELEQKHLSRIIDLQKEKHDVLTQMISEKGNSFALKV